MLQEKVGENAGLIWNALNGIEGLTVKDLKKTLKLTEKEILLSIGWLMREEKLVVEKNGLDYFVKLA